MNKKNTPNNSWLVFDSNKSIRKISTDVVFPISNEDEAIMQKLIDFVKFSQDDNLNEKRVVRPAVGLAAPQIGHNKNMFYVRFQSSTTKTVKEYAMINPKIVGKSEQIVCIEDGEGCLSVKRDRHGIVPRYFIINVKGYDYITKKDINIQLRSYESIVFQHEQDHLKGKLYYDKIIPNKERRSGWLLI